MSYNHPVSIDHPAIVMDRHTCILLVIISCLILLQGSTVAAQATATCEGNASNACGGNINSCTANGLCVIDTMSGNCCYLSTYRENGCVSNQNAWACDKSQLGDDGDDDDAAASVMIVDDLLDDEENDDVAIALQEDDSIVVPVPNPTAAATTPQSTFPIIDDYPTTASTTMEDDEPCYQIEIGLIFDKFPEETRWEITSGKRNSIEYSNATIVKASPYYNPDQDYVEASETHVVCIPRGRYTFTIMDRNNDGLCCANGEGRYALTYRPSGEIITHGAQFNQYESMTFTIPYVTPPLTDVNGDGIEDRTKNVIPKIILSDDGTPGVCSNEFGLHLQTDDYGIETTWELRRRSYTDNYMDGKVVVSGGPYTSDYSYDVTYCLYHGSYTFIFLDWQCDGLIGAKLTGSYELKVNGKTVHTGGGSMSSYYEEIPLEFNSVMMDVSSSNRRMIMGVAGWMLFGVVLMTASFTL